jgi:hypothetical protein
MTLGLPVYVLSNLPVLHILFPGRRYGMKDGNGNVWLMAGEQWCGHELLR